MNVRRLRVVAALTLVLSFRAGDARACSCGGASGAPCEATWRADVVIAGIVRSVDLIDHVDLGAPYQSTLVKFEVERSFVNGSPGIVELITGRGDGDCGYRFVAGKRYLVYASKPGSGRFRPKTLQPALLASSRPASARARGPWKRPPRIWRTSRP